MASPHHPSIVHTPGSLEAVALSFSTVMLSVSAMTALLLSKGTRFAEQLSAFLLCKAAQAGTGLPPWDELQSLSTQGPPKQAPQIPFPGKSPHFSLSPPSYHNAFCQNPFLPKSELVYKFLCYTMQRS